MIDLELDTTTKACLPANFMHGYSSASYQIEGGFQEDGRGLSIWDDVLREAPLGNGDVACDSYNRWQDDVRLLQQYGANTYRFSISWSRIIPLGKWLSWSPVGQSRLNDLICGCVRQVVDTTPSTQKDWPTIPTSYVFRPVGVPSHSSCS
jgi:beta-glucosidase/6-phospho-beta-glucosidase/beta-galactosidase